MRKVVAGLLLAFTVQESWADLDWTCPGRKSLVAPGNNSYSAGRGVSFLMTEDFTLNSFAIKLDLTAADVSINIDEIASNPIDGVVSVVSSLYEDTQNFTCNAEYATFNLADSITLAANKSYHMVIKHNVDPNANYFFDETRDSENNPTETRWSVGSFSLIDGTSGYHSSNTVIADFMVNGSIRFVAEGATVQIPEPASLALIGISGLILLVRKYRM